MKHLLIIFMLLAVLLTACQPEPVQVAEEPDDVDIAGEQDQEPSPEPAIEPPAWPPLSDTAQRIVDAGYFSSDHPHPSPWWPGFLIYANTELGLIYRFDEDEIQAYPELTIIAPDEWSAPGLLMAMPGHMFLEELRMYVIDGCGEEWLQERADYALENIIRLLLGEFVQIEAWYMEHYGDDYEENLAYRIARRDAWVQQRREIEGDAYEHLFSPLTLAEVESVAFWPVEYEVVGRVFTGLQINHILRGYGGSIGRTYLFSQINDDIAVVMFIYSRECAGAVARRVIARFEAIS